MSDVTRKVYFFWTPWSRDLQGEGGGDHPAHNSSSLAIGRGFVLGVLFFLDK